MRGENYTLLKCYQIDITIQLNTTINMFIKGFVLIMPINRSEERRVGKEC